MGTHIVVPIVLTVAKDDIRKCKPLGLSYPSQHVTLAQLGPRDIYEQDVADNRWYSGDEHDYGILG